MKTRRGKHSEPFWPSIVMKKWLNIKPKVYDFSADEVDTESEDDACSLKDERLDVAEDHARRIHGNQSVCTSQTPGTPLKGHTLRHRRGKSETLRVQYINTKDVRVTIGTWNVAGRLPYEGLDLDEWLCMKEAADIYILGFQEVVPLNAGNVLGAETRRPIPKWESIIRRTLNRSLEPESKHKSYSAPPSPVLRTSDDDDILADETNDSSFEILGDGPIGTTDVSDSKVHKLNEIVRLRKKLQLKRLYGIDSDGRLDWPEQSLDSTHQVLASSYKLRRVFSSSARVGSDWMENPPMFSPQNVAPNGMKRSHRSSGNLGLIWMDQEERPDNLDSVSDVSDHFSKEEEDDSILQTSEEQHENGLMKDGLKSHPTYARIVSKQMVGIYISVWVRRRLRRHINNLKVSPVGVGLMGYMGNKGSISVSMSLFQTRLCFVCSHLTSGHKDGDKQRRNSDVQEILRRTQFSSVCDIDQPETIPSHDQIFWFGDLNYRLNMLDAEVRKLVAKKQWNELLNSDQLSKELCSGHVFDGWKEGAITFPPTYKYEINTDRYVGENPKEGEKKRSPAWCDRVLWLGKGIKQLSYRRADMRLSDHRPVSSVFLVEVEVFDHRKLQRALNFTTAAFHPQIFFDEDEEFEL
ncbi:Type I inositol polyphosphate 5-phosphatase [Actinidia chinensis var. chinensis]|uniref:Type I inositol polyphosphate 5-phosphatase n=1 Tax=Actinidia chinensis var. chinensis TaxID=1590841 RepID=A0A2R6QNX4_ACTCC|nr:Type I inositol polyphosphate 5-phosphatase [Actinidia chinensis var. chinensis]